MARGLLSPTPLQNKPEKAAPNRVNWVSTPDLRGKTKGKTRS